MMKRKRTVRVQVEGIDRSDPWVQAAAKDPFVAAVIEDIDRIRESHGWYTRKPGRVTYKVDVELPR